MSQHGRQTHDSDAEISSVTKLLQLLSGIHNVCLSLCCHLNRFNLFWHEEYSGAVFINCWLSVKCLRGWDKVWHNKTKPRSKSEKSACSHKTCCCCVVPSGGAKQKPCKVSSLNAHTSHSFVKTLLVKGCGGCVVFQEQSTAFSQPWVLREALAPTCCVSFHKPLIIALFVHMGVISFANRPWCACGLCSVQSMNDDLNASLAVADELSREFNDMLKEASSNNNNTKSAPQVHTHANMLAYTGHEHFNCSSAEVWTILFFTCESALTSSSTPS